MLPRRRCERISIENGRFARTGSVWPKLSGTRVIPTNHSSWRKISINVLACGVRMWVQVFIVSSQYKRLKTDGQTYWEKGFRNTVHRRRRITCSRTVITINSSVDEIANVMFLNDDIVHALETIDSCINSATDRRSYVLKRRFTEFSEMTQCNGHYAVQGHSRSPIFVPIESPYTISY